MTERRFNTGALEDRSSRLSSLILRNSAYEVLGHATGQAMRLGSNLVLTRVLFPEAFGLMAIVSIVLFGLTMLSDVGILQAVIRSPRGDDENFLNTAWTLQILRGGMLCLATWIASYPVSIFYGQTQLFPLLLVAGVQLLIAGFESTSLFTLRRRIASRHLVTIELGVQLATVITVVSSALLWRSVWALILGAIAGGIVRLIWSHLLDVGYRNQICWETSARDEIFRFGRWIFGSSIASFLSTQSDRIFLGQLLGMATLGVYTIALLLSEAIGAAMSKVISGVFFPTFSRVYNEDPDRLCDEYYDARLKLDLAALPALGALTMLGDFLVSAMWDTRYTDAGWMLRILCVRVAVACVMLPCAACLVATGESRFGFARELLTMLMIVIGVPVGYMMNGAQGLVWAVALSQFPAAVILWPAAAERGLFRVRREALAVALFLFGMLLGALIRYVLSGSFT